MAFFFDGSESYAAIAFKEAIKAQGLTYATFAAKIGVSSSTLNQFVAGRALTPKLLATILAGLPKAEADAILIGHLRDEVQRVGIDPNGFSITQRKGYGLVLEELNRMLASSPARVAELLSLMESWGKPVKTGGNEGRKPAGKTSPARSASKSTAARLLPD